MNFKSIGLLLMSLVTISAVSFAQKSKKDTIKVFLLAGQSNMDGYGYVKELPKNLSKTQKDIWIFHGNSAADDDTQNGSKGIWEQLKPGHGTGFNSDGEKNNLSDRFGVELSFAQRIQELYPNDKIAIIKYSRGGTAIDTLVGSGAGCWEPDFNGKTGINQYDHCLKTVQNAFNVNDINNDGKEDVLVPMGIVWMQGESDAHSEETGLRYYYNLKRLMNLLRASLRVDDLPVVVGKISDSWNDPDGKVWDWGELVQYAEEKFAKTDAKAGIVRTTRYYKYSDKWHYDSPGFIDLGKQFANKAYELNEGKVPEAK